jgi:hypothetical protein
MRGRALWAMPSVASWPSLISARRGASSGAERSCFEILLINM